MPVDLGKTVHKTARERFTEATLLTVDFTRQPGVRVDGLIRGGIAVKVLSIMVTAAFAVLAV